MKGAQLPHAALFLQSVLFCFVLFCLTVTRKSISIQTTGLLNTHLCFFFFFLTKQKTAVYPQLISCGASVLCLKPPTLLSQLESKAVACRTVQSLCLKAYFTQGHFQEELKHPASTYKWPDDHSYIFFVCLVTVDVRTGGLTRLTRAISHTALLQLPALTSIFEDGNKSVEKSPVR